MLDHMTKWALCVVLVAACEGSEGPQGEPGAAGPQGAQGDPGGKGDTGDKGPAGSHIVYVDNAGMTMSHYFPTFRVGSFDVSNVYFDANNRIWRLTISSTGVVTAIPSVSVQYVGYTGASCTGNVIQFRDWSMGYNATFNTISTVDNFIHVYPNTAPQTYNVLSTSTGAGCTNTPTTMVGHPLVDTIPVPAITAPTFPYTPPFTPTWVD